MDWVKPIFERLGRIILAILVAFDQLCQTALVAPFSLLGLAGIPDPDETVSGILGRRSQDQLWAHALSLPIDALFLILTFGVERNHCQLAAEREARRNIEKKLGTFLIESKG